MAADTNVLNEDAIEKEMNRDEKRIKKELKIASRLKKEKKRSKKQKKFWKKCIREVDDLEELKKMAKSFVDSLFRYRTIANDTRSLMSSMSIREDECDEKSKKIKEKYDTLYKIVNESHPELLATIEKKSK